MIGPLCDKTIALPLCFVIMNKIKKMAKPMTQLHNTIQSQPNLGLSIVQQDQISDDGAAACRAVGKENWKNNPYPPQTLEHDIWLGGYEREADCIGSQGKNW